MATLYIIRHGQTDWNVSRKVMGRTDVPLNETGLQQARELEEVTRDLKIDAIYSSPQLRARQTAEPLAQTRKLKVQSEPALAEVDYSKWVGLTYEELFRDPAYQHYLKDPISPKNDIGEAIREVWNRTTAFANRLVQKDPEGSFALVSHGDPIRTLLCYALSMPIEEYRSMRIANASLSMLIKNEQRWVLTIFNYRKNPDWKAEL